jgi:hypothetical protein
MAWQHSIDITGDRFFPSRMPFSFTESWDPNTRIRERGPYKGQLAPYGYACFVVPQSVDVRRRIEFLADTFEPLIPTLRGCGAEEWEVWIMREYHAQCNEEFAPAEIVALCRLQCSLCYSAFSVNEEREREWPNHFPQPTPRAAD